MLEAGHTCKGFHPASGDDGAPFSTDQNDNDCAPIVKSGAGSRSVCDSISGNDRKPLCYCEDGMDP